MHGGAILANDMHLALTSPGIWYRAQMNWPDRSVNGLTLPGVPGLITGSNGDVAWGFTNTEGDFQDLILIDVHPENPNLYRTPDGWKPFEKITETINVHGRKAVKLNLRLTIWGIVTGTDYKGRPLVLNWVALMPEAINLNLLDMLEVESLDDFCTAGLWCSAARSHTPQAFLLLIPKGSRYPLVLILGRVANW